MNAVNETAAVITHAQADLIASNLRAAGMDTRVGGGEGPGPIFRWCTGTQVLAAVVALVKAGDLPLPFLLEQDWQTVSFEETNVDGHWSSIELLWSDRRPLAAVRLCQESVGGAGHYCGRPLREGRCMVHGPVGR